jgi:hypothetical protein
MIPTKFPESNIAFQPPPDLGESQCGVIHGFAGEIAGGSCDGLPLMVVAWRPTAEELEQINAGACIYLSLITEGLPPHFLTTDFHQATHPA